MTFSGIKKGEILSLLQAPELCSEIRMNDDLLISQFSKFPPSESQSLSWFNGTSLPQDFRLPPSSLLVCSDQLDVECISRISNVIVTQHPKYVFALLAVSVQSCIAKESNQEIASIHRSVELSSEVTLGSGVTIGPNTVVIGNVSIGSNVHIGANCVIGSPGFGFAKGPDGVYIRVPHVGGVIIGDNVEIGNNACIDSGTFESTVIGNNVKIDNLVHIAHNVTIGERTLITACAEISGSVKIGSDVWIAPNVSIIQKVSIGDGALVGIGSTVTKDVSPGLTVFGSPARAVPGKT